MLDVVLDVTEEIDETLGAEMGLEKSSLSFKKLNTLYEYGIIKENNKKTYKLI
jgi:transcription initiation factor IIE alpha subunit